MDVTAQPLRRTSGGLSVAVGFNPRSGGEKPSRRVSDGWVPASLTRRGFVRSSTVGWCWPDHKNPRIIDAVRLLEHEIWQLSLETGMQYWINPAQLSGFQVTYFTLAFVPE